MKVFYLVLTEKRKAFDENVDFSKKVMSTFANVIFVLQNGLVINVQVTEIGFCLVDLFVQIMINVEKRKFVCFAKPFIMISVILVPVKNFLQL